MQNYVKVLLQKGRNGSSLFVVFGIMTVLFIFGASFMFISSSQISFIYKMEARIKARYLAESAIQKAVNMIHRQFQKELVYAYKGDQGEELYEVNEKLLDLIDIRRIEDYVRVHNFAKDELMPGGEAQVLVEVKDVKSNEFYTFIDYQEKIPESLKVHQKPRNAKTVVDLEPLGGFKARIKFSACGKYDKTVHCEDLVKTLGVSDITPPAPDHTLFIHSKKAEKLKMGEFALSNLTLPPVIVKLLYRLSQQTKEILGIEIGQDRSKTMDLIDELNKQFNQTFRSQSLKQKIRLIQELSAQVADDDISETVDNIILSLSPRNWGRVRTNGRLEVYMPFFAADDIINYFAEKGSWRELPEVGYLFHDNRLHDPYMSVYTHYEGLIYKRYRKIYPSQFGVVEPEEVPPEQYTINTRLEYPRRYKERYHIQNLDRLKDFGFDVANTVFEKKVSLKGTKEEPLQLEGIWWFRNGLEIGGYYSGRGIIVSEQAIRVTDDLLESREKDSIALVSLHNEIVLGKRELKLQSALYAHNGLKKGGCESVRVYGNLAVEKLNREAMPKKFFCRFDYHLKNHMVDNIYGHIPQNFLYFRELDGVHPGEIFSDVSAIDPL